MIDKVRELDNFDGVKNQPIDIKDMDPIDIPSNFIIKK